MKTSLLWALWISVGGAVRAVPLTQTYISAYFKTVDECKRVQDIVYPQVKWAQCIQAEYVVLNTPSR